MVSTQYQIVGQWLEEVHCLQILIAHPHLCDIDLLDLLVLIHLFKIVRLETPSSRQDQDLLARLCDKGHTPVNLQRLKTLLERSPDIHVANELLCGFTNGFRLQYTGPRCHSNSQQLISALQYKEETMKKLRREIDMGRMLGPFAELPISTLHNSLIGLVPKSDGTWRLIINLSYPCDNSINTFIDDKFCKVKYSTFDDILDKIYDLGPRA